MSRRASPKEAGPTTYAIRTAIVDVDVERFAFTVQKTMYGGKRIAAGDTIYLFSSESEGGRGLIGRGVVTTAVAVPKTPGVARQTPRVDLEIRPTATAARPLGRAELKGFKQWNDGRPETELNFKLYRQATDKVIGVSEGTAAFLERYCGSAGDLDADRGAGRRGMRTSPS